MMAGHRLAVGDVSGGADRREPASPSTYSQAPNRQNGRSSTGPANSHGCGSVRPSSLSGLLRSLSGNRDAVALLRGDEAVVVFGVLA